MKRIALIAIALVGCALGAMAQKFALVDMEYVLKNIPAYEIANEQVNQMSLRWQKEVDVLAEEADKMYKDYQSNMVFLTDEQKLEGENGKGEGRRRAAPEVFRPGGRSVRASSEAHGADSGRGVQCREGGERGARIPVYLRPCLVGRHNIRLAAD